MTITALARPLPGRRVHFVAIGGVGMAALAEILVHMGYEVSGSDLKESRTTKRLEGLGVPVAIGRHAAENAMGAEHVVVSAAVPRGNPEVDHALTAGAQVLSRAALLGLLFKSGRGVAVTGTHGKTTTSSMLAWVLRQTGLDPTFVVGGDLNDVGSGAALGSSDLVVAEADEAYGSFLELESALAVVTNIDADHLDFYEGQDGIDEAFRAFLDKRRPDGPAVVCADDPGVRRLLPAMRAPVTTYGMSAGDLRVAPAGSGWTITKDGREIGTFTMRLPGRHNALNAAGVVAAALHLGAEAGLVLEALSSFSGVDRRFSVRGSAAGVTVVDDYAHNPGKVAATISAARDAYPGRRVIALFQPHLYSRTRLLAGDLGAALAGADVVVVTDVYGAREHPEPGVTGRLVSDATSRSAGDRLVAFVPRLEEAAGVVAGLAQDGDVVLTLGAGDVTLASPRILALLGGESPGSADEAETQRPTDVPDAPGS